jgi:7-cyano-7-deazaguanine synthase
VRAIALLSGGLDSVVATWAAAREGTIALALTFDYGQRARQAEARAAARVAAALGCPHRVLPLPWLGELGGSALTDPEAAVPEPDASDLDDLDAGLETARAVWVPNRNGVFVNVAAAFAEALDCDCIVCGFNLEEAATFADNSVRFMQAADAFLALSTLRHPTLLSPTASLDKAQIVALGVRLNAPLEAVWSCYHDAGRMCWRCESCLRLKRALEANGLWPGWPGPAADAGA